VKRELQSCGKIPAVREEQGKKQKNGVISTPGGGSDQRGQIAQ
jgi:hypothetical protein